MRIIDNFLEKEHFKKIQQTMMGVEFPWYYQKSSNYKKEGLSQLTHGFYNYKLSKRANSPFLEILTPILKKLDAIGLIRIKANLTYPAKEHQEMHVDVPFKNAMTAIYYINSNNGGTKIKQKKDTIVNSIENRMVIVAVDTPHAVIRHTNSKVGRFVINFNYYENTETPKNGWKDIENEN